ncbi:MAG: ATP-binding protein [Ginsengibacter sp.]
MNVTDLTNCDKEPIHIPGKIQSHGFLVIIDKFFTILGCSENISNFLTASSSSLLNKPAEALEILFKKDGADGFIIPLIKSAESKKGFEPSNPYSISISGKSFNLIFSCEKKYYLLEFEPEMSDLQSDINRNLSSSLSVMLSDSRLSILLQRSAEEIQKIIGYDRVMIYKFHQDGHGEVVAEVKNKELGPLMGLHYPASDIPKQARELYKINLTRLIADVNNETSAIALSDDFGIGSPDLTHSVLRAVSPIHIQYLKNMGVASSFSISLLYQGELWGLVACHNYSPRYINYNERVASKLIGQVLSSALSFRQAEEDEYLKNRLKIAVDALTNQLLRYGTIEEALFKQEGTLLDVAGATGAALFFDNKLYTGGNVPDEEFILELIDWLYNTIESQLYETNRLPLIYAPSAGKRTQATGLLACRLSKEVKDCLLWFRPEVITTINWAGNPDKPVEYDSNGLINISPRNSFETWSQTVQNTSVPWKNEELKSVLQVKEEIAFALRRKALELRQLNEKLQEAYDELDAFSYTISHDLKNPITSIKSYSQMLTQYFNLEPKAQHMVDRILSVANKMNAMIQEVLHYSRIGQSKLTHNMVSMDQILNEVKQEQLVVNQKHSPEINIGDTPAIYGDKTMIMQVFSNLVGNGVKYSSRNQQPHVTINGEDIGNEIRYTVTDNGIGIKPGNHEKIFDLFARADEAQEYEGSGVGLSIVKKIMEKHGGNIWLKSDPDKGSVFYVSFRKKESVSVSE